MILLNFKMIRCVWNDYFINLASMFKFPGKNSNSILNFIIYFRFLCLTFTFGTLNFHKLFPRTYNLHSWYHHAFQHQFDPKNLHDLSNSPELYLPIIQSTRGYMKLYFWSLGQHLHIQTYILIKYLIWYSFCNAKFFRMLVLLGIFIFLAIDSSSQDCKIHLVFK